ncbi:MAG: hypothetical protein KGJ62_14260 [Armatimonadetes bacterium]|nr:hypothetical protein [Armatimonadota bacterium]MDE2207071.1 hypothetical protein [Armatimonadota bacterium]
MTRYRLFEFLAAIAMLLTLPGAVQRPADPAQIAVLMVGGGPSRQYNQVAIESNMRYVGRLLPSGATVTSLFADGDAGASSVEYASSDRALGARVLSLALDRVTEDDPTIKFRQPAIGRNIDGSNRKSSIDSAFGRLRSFAVANPTEPVLIYFTGHGSPNRRNIEDNYYDTWNESRGLSVRALAAEIARLPATTPVTIVMVQCFSGAFGNLLFDNGDPSAPQVRRDLVGFFATVEDRVAAGCTTAVNEAEYHDFTSYFFAALTGRDRVGRKVEGADYNHDGRVGMDEAFCYTLIHDQSIDVPVCTSDVFLRRFVPMSDAAVTATRFKDLLKWARPAQRAALSALQKELKLRGPSRFQIAYNEAVKRLGKNAGMRSTTDPGAIRSLNRQEQSASRYVLAQWPSLQHPDAPEAKPELDDALTALTDQAVSGRWKKLLDADDRVEISEKQGEASEIADSKLLRFIRLAKSVVLAHRLQTAGTPAAQAAFNRLSNLEARSLLPKAGPFATTVKTSADGNGAEQTAMLLRELRTATLRCCAESGAHGRGASWF